jgi:hypothetical protein
MAQDPNQGLPNSLSVAHIFNAFQDSLQHTHLAFSQMSYNLSHRTLAVQYVFQYVFEIIQKDTELEQAWVPSPFPPQ